MSDDDSFDYGNGDGFEDELSYEEGDSDYGSPGDDDGSPSYGKSPGDESPGGYAGEGDLGEEGLNFGETFADIERTGGGAIKTGAGFMGGAKAARSAEQAAAEKAQGILAGENMYSDVKQGEKDKILSLISRVPNVERASIEVLIAALLFKVRRIELSAKNFQTFYKNLEGIEAADLLRYIRQYSDLK